MKGVLFTVFEEYVVEHHGIVAFEQILDDASVSTHAFVGPDVYPPSDMVSLVSSAAAHLGVSVDEVLRGYGRHAFPALARSVGPMMAGFSSAAQFLSGLEPLIHTEVRKVDLDARPARFHVSGSGDGSLRVRYDSPLGLFGLVEGMLDGVADWFGEAIEHEIVEIDGTNAVFRVRFPGDRSGEEAGGASGREAAAGTGARV